jgi:hypothetical protein
VPDDHPARDEDLGPREAARIRRRDQDAGAASRDLMRPGMGKVFKQIQDAQVKVGKSAAPAKSPGAAPARRVRAKPSVRDGSA